MPTTLLHAPPLFSDLPVALHSRQRIADPGAKEHILKNLFNHSKMCNIKILKITTNMLQEKPQIYFASWF